MSGRPFVTFGAPRIGTEEIREVVATLRSGWIGPGPRAQRFAEAFRSYTGARHVVPVSSGTASLHLALLAAGLRPGDEVITTPLTFAATANAIMAAGATPRFADVDLRSQNLDPDRVARAVGRRTRAILPVHLAGRPCDMEGILDIARRRKLKVIEDTSHAIEALLHGRHAGTIGNFGCFSFTYNKNITTGEGGAVVTGDAAAARRIATYAAQGLSADSWRRFQTRGAGRYSVVTPGFKCAMTDLNAAIGVHQLKHVERWWLRRRTIWDLYTSAFEDLPVWLPSRHVPDGRHALHLFTVHLDLERLRGTRDEIRAELKGRGIGTGVHYTSLHLEPYYRRRFGFSPADFPNARCISERTMSLPLSPHLSDSDVEHVVSAFRATLHRAARRKG